MASKDGVVGGLEKGKTLGLGLITRVRHPAEHLEEDGGAEVVLLAMPPVTGAG
eukprot:CAMPEP_0184667922 /NCGR_PEP_ID=MMETSP0308-20130426/69895_1 /TAXON_ID=38269 /ORGANISM="Gloeochaete witrockiana, Strain SAG 46.84" /LENGTH=52 /DNA_ID=CAMNT_0027113375 /DNA_START=108 /DNA_END=262 /DNA_ORIENTATION=-